MDVFTQKIGSRMSKWAGPYKEGITQSLLQKFFLCRDRFWLQVVAGYRERQTWEDVEKMEFGSLFHEALEADFAGRSTDEAIEKYTNKLRAKYQSSAVAILNTAELVRREVNAYLRFWGDADKKKYAVLQEEVFKIPYKLPSGKVIHLKGKWDSVIKPTKRSRSIYLMEHKTKGFIDEQGMSTQLKADLQVGLYLTALTEWAKVNKPNCKVEGVLYNVIRRPFGDKSAPRKYVKETLPELYERAFTGKGAKKPFPEKSLYPIDEKLKKWFMRWNSLMTPKDLAHFQRTYLNGVLENCVFGGIVLR